MIGGFLDIADLKPVIAAMKASGGFMNATIFRPAGGVSNWNVYKTMADALSKYRFLNKIAGGKDVAAVKNIKFTDAKATTFGKKVDFYGYIPVLGLVPMTYNAVKMYAYDSSKISNYIARFYDKQGAGPYYAVIDPRYMSIAATKGSGDVRVIQAQDAYLRELDLAKSRYNTIAQYIFDLSKKSKPSASEKTRLADARNMLQKYEKDLRGIKDIDIVFSKDGTVNGIGIVPVLIWVVAIVAGAIVTAYTIEQYIKATANVKTINASYDFEKWSADHEQVIDKEEKAGTITAEAAVRERDHLQVAQEAAQKTVETASAPTPGIMDHLQTFALIGAGVFLISKMM